MAGPADFARVLDAALGEAKKFCDLRPHSDIEKYISKEELQEMDAAFDKSYGGVMASVREADIEAASDELQRIGSLVVKLSLKIPKPSSFSPRAAAESSQPSSLLGKRAAPDSQLSLRAGVFHPQNFCSWQAKGGRGHKRPRLHAA